MARWFSIGARSAAGVAGAVMAAATVMTGRLPAPEEIPQSPGAVESATKSSSAANGPVEDREPHSYKPTMPADICANPASSCGFARTH
jgi:hypothetical protein